MDPSIWNCLKNQNGEEFLLTSCGAELQELMRQMDIMVKNKKLEWEAELATAKDCLVLRDQELCHSRALLEQKQEEVVILKQQIESYESGQNHVVKDYESQLSRLKCQMQNLKDGYEKMQRHRSKKEQASEDKEREMLSEIEHLQTDLKRHQALSVQHEKDRSDWEVRIKSLQHQIKGLESKKRALEDAHARLKYSSRAVKDLEGTGQSLLKKLEKELAKDKVIIQRQESQIAELQSKTRELNGARHSATSEKYRYQEQADKANCRLKVLEEEVNNLQAALSAQESALKGSEHEIADLTNQKEKLESTVHAKEKIIESMQLRSPLKNEEDCLKQKVAMLEATIEIMMKTEKNLRDEVQSLTQQLETLKDEARKLNACVQKNENDKIVVVNDEIRRLRGKLENMESSNSAQLCVMKADVTKLASHLHGRDANIAQLGESCAEMEKQLREESHLRDKLDTELQIAAANLKLLREQRKSVSNESPGFIDTSNADKSLVEAECELSDLRKSYGKAVERLEDENQQLKSQVSSLKNELIIQERSDRNQYDAKVENEEDAEKKNVLPKDERIKGLCNAYEDRIAALEAKLQEMQPRNKPPQPSSVSSSIAIRSLSSNSSRTITPVSAMGTNDSDIDRTPTPTKEFLRSIGIDPASVGDSSLSFPPSLAGSLSERQLQSLFGVNDEGFDEVRIPSIEDFASGEEKRAEQLESKIEQHIGDMRIAMDLAMEKYFK